MTDRNSYARCKNDRSVRHHICRLCGWQWIVLQWDHLLPNYRYDVCCDCARDRWENELKGVVWWDTELH